MSVTKRLVLKGVKYRTYQNQAIYWGTYQLAFLTVCACSNIKSGFKMIGIQNGLFYKNWYANTTLYNLKHLYDDKIMMQIWSHDWQNELIILTELRFPLCDLILIESENGTFENIRDLFYILAFNFWKS